MGRRQFRTTLRAIAVAVLLAVRAMCWGLLNPVEREGS